MPVTTAIITVTTAAAASAARRFGWDATVDALLEVYAEAMAGRLPRSQDVRLEPVLLPAVDLAVAP